VLELCFDHRKIVFCVLLFALLSFNRCLKDWLGVIELYNTKAPVFASDEEVFFASAVYVRCVQNSIGALKTPLSLKLFQRWTKKGTFARLISGLSEEMVEADSTDSPVHLVVAECAQR